MIFFEAYFKGVVGFDSYYVFFICVVNVGF
jgi:hypothetical protein